MKSTTTPHNKSSFYQFLRRNLFIDQNEVIVKGMNSKLLIGELPPLDEDETAENLLLQFEKYQNGGTRSLSKSLFMVVRRDIMFSVIYMIFYIIFELANPLFLYYIVKSINNDDFTGLYLSFGLGVNVLLSSLTNQNQLFHAFKVGRKLRSLFINLTFKHLFELNLATYNKIQPGLAISLLSTDSQKVLEFVNIANLLWGSPILIAVSSFFLILFLSTTAIYGIIVLVAVLPVSYSLAKLAKYYRKQHLPYLDKRIQLCSEILTGIRLVKYFSWESKFEKKVMDIRKKEMKYIAYEIHLWAVNTMFSILSPVFATLVTFSIYAKVIGPLESEFVFASFAFFNTLKFPLMFLGQVISQATQVFISFKRLKNFLELTDPNKMAEVLGLDVVVPGNEDTMGKSSTYGSSQSHLVTIEKAEFQFSQDKSADFKLSNVSLTLDKGELVAIVGSVGAGKSMLVQSILKELYIAKGTVLTKGSIGYVGQEPFLINSSIRDNILFGRDFDDDKYRHAIDTCSLWKDLASFHEEADGKIVGENGETLSGGQKARVSLARAVYSQNDIILLDDPFSALDAATGSHVFNSLLAKDNGFLRSTSGVILVTHALAYLPQIDKIIIMGSTENDTTNGIHFQGTYNEVVSHAEKYINDHRLKNDTPLHNIYTSILNAKNGPDNQASSNTPTEDDIEPSIEEDTIINFQENVKLTDVKGSLTDTEESGVGLIGWDTYKGYIEMLRFNVSTVLSIGGRPVVAVVFILILLERVTFLVADYWISTWSDAAERPPETGFGAIMDLPQADSSHVNYYITIYSIIVLLNVIFLFIRLNAVSLIGWLASKRMFEKLIKQIFSTSMLFFDSTPIGRIINRCSYDVDITDYLLIILLNTKFTTYYWLASAVLVISISIPYMLVIFIPAIISFFVLVHYYMKTSVQLQRLDVTSRSPLNSHFQETISGIPTIKSFNTQHEFIKKCNELTDINNTSINHFTKSQCWLGLRVEFMGGLIVLSCSIGCWALRNSLKGGAAGLAILWSFNLVRNLSYYVTFAIQAESKLNSVERILYYVDTLEHEDVYLNSMSESNPDRCIGGTEVDLSLWPIKGDIVFKDVVMRYRPELEPSLIDVCVHFEGGTRVSIVGRSGSGKSTMAVALFRMCGLSRGSITVDGIDLSTINLNQVRGKGICIIPQDPVLFSGSLRTNLDPFDDHTDAELWDALQCVRMHEIVGQLEAKLLYVLSENGANFSVGQRQLLCLARALLRKPKILIMDEATASVDPITEEFIQKTVHLAFKGCTIIEIAHRLQPVMRCDKVLVMSAGRVLEYNTPLLLLKNKDSALSNLVDSTGAIMAAHLRHLAHKIALHPSSDTLPPVSSSSLTNRPTNSRSSIISKRLSRLSSRISTHSDHPSIYSAFNNDETNHIFPDYPPHY